MLEEQQDPSLADELFKKIARLHAMNVPLPKKPWFSDNLDEFYETFNSSNSSGKLLVKENCPQLCQPEFRAQIDWVKHMLSELNSPLVFSHNDLVSNNIMVLDHKLDNGDQVIMCDFEHGGYEHRCLDLGMILTEWGRLWTSMDIPQSFADDSTLKRLLQIYTNEMVKIFGNSYTENPVNSMEQLVKEAKIFSMAFKMFIILWYLKTVVATLDTSIDAKTSVVSYLSLAMIQYLT